MKNFINYYYNLKIVDIYFIDNIYIINDEKFRYVLKVYDNTQFLSYYNYLKNSLIKYEYFFEIIPNNADNYVSVINNKPYVLMKISNIKNDLITIFDIKNDMFIDYNNKLLGLTRFPWNVFWERKVDYFEEIFYLKKDKYNNIYALFYYFVGLAENAIMYFKDSVQFEKKDINDELVISHNRISVNFRFYDYYDPTNIILDHPSRDISEFVKSLFINNCFDLTLFNDYLNSHYFSRYGLRMLYARIIFPSFFFDYIEKMLIEDSEIDLLYLENRVEGFQTFSKNISLFFRDKYNIPIIPWLIK